MNEEINGQKRLLIVGAGRCGELILEEIKQKKLHYNPIGFVDDNQQIIGKNVLGLPVLDNIDNIVRIIKEHDIDEILIAIPSLSGESLKRVIDKCKETKKQTKIVPALFDILRYMETEDIEKKKTVDLLPGKIRNINYEDIVKRSPPAVDIEGVKKVIEGKTVMITGAAGSIGSVVSAQVIKFSPKRLILIDMSEYGIHKLLKNMKGENVEIILGDIKNEKKMEKIIKEKEVNIIINAAAYKHIDIVETNPEEAVMNNVLGTYNLLKLADKYKIDQLVLISTDKAVEPVSAMGSTKRICELMVQHMPKNKTRFSAVRFGNVIGSSGSLFEIWGNQIKEGRLDVTDANMTRYFMLTQEAAVLTLETLVFPEESAIFTFDMGEPFKIMDLAKKWIEYNGFEVNKDIKINIIGIRKGERLHEKLVHNHEGLIRTKNERISMIKQNKSVKKEGFFGKIEELIDCAKKNDEENLRRIMKEIIE